MTTKDATQAIEEAFAGFAEHAQPLPGEVKVLIEEREDGRAWSLAGWMIPGESGGWRLSAHLTGVRPGTTDAVVKQLEPIAKEFRVNLILSWRFADGRAAPGVILPAID